MGFCMRASWEARICWRNDTGEKNAGVFNCAADHRQAKRRELLREKEPGARQERGGAQERTRDSPSPAAGLGAGAWPI